jgi:YVTN family beta-propeller protein
MIFKRTAVAILAVVVPGLLAGCGDYFRPVANPILQPGGDPQRNAHVVMITQDTTSPTTNPGFATTIDAPGDTNVGVVSVGIDPVNVKVLLGGQVVVSNAGDDTLSIFSTVLPTQAPSTILLPAGGHPVWAASTEASTVYVVLQGTSPPSLGVVGLSSGFITKVDVGVDPVFAVESPDAKKVYVVNHDSDNVSVLNTVDDSTSPAIPVGSSPVYAVVSNDSSLLFVLNQGDSTVSVINTLTGQPAVAPIAVGAGPNYAYFDNTLHRLYVTNYNDSSLSIIDASTSTPVLKATLPLGPAPCGGSAPIGVRALPDGSKVYVANQGSNNVCVLVTTNNLFVRNIPVQTSPISIASSLDGSRVFVANAGSKTLSDIQTIDDTVVATIPAPTGQTPVYLAIGP